MDWSSLFLQHNPCVGVNCGSQNQGALLGLAQIWSFVNTLLTWDIVKGGIVFMLAVSLVALLIQRLQGAFR